MPKLYVLGISQFQTLVPKPFNSTFTLEGFSPKHLSRPPVSLTFHGQQHSEALKIIVVHLLVLEC